MGSQKQMNSFDRLNGRKDVVLDTMFFIYLFEDSPRYGILCESVVNMISDGMFSGLITPLTAAEIVVKPLAEGMKELADRYIAELKGMVNVGHAVSSIETGHMAGALKAKYKLPLPDMFQMAAAMQTERPAIITNDKALKKVSEVEVFILDDML